MRALGADIVNTRTDDGMGGAIDRAYELAAEQESAVVPEQFSNPLNAEAHYETTGPEIYEALDGDVGAIVAGCGTAGTLMGMARYAREQDPDTYVAAVEPTGSLFATTKGEDVEKEEYIIEGIGTHDTARNELFEPDLVDEVIQIENSEAHAELKRLAREEGQLVASSAGAASLAAQRVARAMRDGEIDAPGSAVATIFPDSSERYLSKDIYGSYEEWEAHS
jgi:cysteine synthase